MPPVEKHTAISRTRTGKDFREVHAWLDDADPRVKTERHDITRIFTFGRIIEKEYGTEGLNEYLQHIHDDLAAKFEHLQHDIEKMTGEVLSYFGIERGAH